MLLTDDEDVNVKYDHFLAPQVKGGNILFVRGETQGQDRDGTDTTRVVNPDEINIDEDDEDVNEESSEDEGTVAIQCLVREISNNP